MDTIKYTRTTVTIPEELLFEIKKKALLERKTAKEIINDSLNIYLSVSKAEKEEKAVSIVSLFGAWGKDASGIKYVHGIRNAKAERERKRYLSSLWKKS